MPVPEPLVVLKKPLTQPIKSAAIEMNKVTRSARLRLSAQNLFARWPNLREASHRLTGLLTVYWPDSQHPEESLLQTCLIAGFIAAEKEFNRQHDDMAEQQAFINSIYTNLTRCLEVTLMVRSKTGWSPYDLSVDGYLDTLINAAHSQEFAWIQNPQIPSNNSKAQLICASRVFTLTELSVAGRLD
ncbi:MAG: hypothetical protein Q7U98_18160 [Methylicorpusculum sp.]|uniref:hypothetical protein n=1 Tax=Methylicorpusculum sp. TaxID=2713644 RepID=UPI0027197364|nr:hypothetical protein [Methylicorpusculum sp.]MDO8941082.1 hypothetical protein [Methylicorpusculum sp.]MDP2202319.1 hypothetical protein [Methylicorpusculum sp.]